jgi:hypothetical protein
VFALQGPEAAAKWMCDELGSPATPRWIHDQTLAGNIVYSVVCNKRCYSTLELYNFAMSLAKRGGNGPLAGKPQKRTAKKATA